MMGPTRDSGLWQGLDGCGKDEMCLVSPCEQDEDPSGEGFT